MPICVDADMRPQSEAFIRLKEKLTLTPVLTFYDKIIPIIVSGDVRIFNAFSFFEWICAEHQYAQIKG